MKRLIISLLFSVTVTFTQDTTWTKTFGGDGGGTDIGYSVKQTTDGGYIKLELQIFIQLLVLTAMFCC